jgi:hypothetical protein
VGGGGGGGGRQGTFTGGRAEKGLCDLKFVCGESIYQSRCMNLKQ